MTVDISAHVPILVGVIGRDGAADAAPGDVTTPFATLLNDLRAAYPHTPVVVVSTFTAKVEQALRQVALDMGLTVIERAAADGDPEAQIVYYSDILVATPHRAVSPEIAAVAAARATREHPHERRRLLAPPDAGPCLHLAGDDRSAPEFTALLRLRDRLNRDLGRTGEPPPGAALERLRARVEAETAMLQGRTRAWQIALYVLAVAGALCQLYSVLGPNVPLVVARVAVVVLAFAGWFFFVHRTDRQNRYQDYRAFSEALRVQLVWSAIGIRNGVDESYLAMQQTELQWIRNAIRTVLFFDDRRPASDARAVVRDWVREQRDYFRRTALGEKARRNNIGKAAFILGLLSTALGLTTLAGFVHLLPRIGGERLGLVASAFALLVAVLESYARTRGYAENANRYQRMSFVFGKADELLEAQPDAAQLHAIATELGREALAEQADWLLARRERPIKTVDAIAT